MNKATTRLLPYILAGFLIGVFFPLLGTLIGFLETGQAFTWAAAAAMHRDQPLYWIIDFAPLVLTLFTAIIGNRSLRYLDTSHQLDELIHEQNRQMQNESQFFKSLIAGSPIAVVQLDVNHNILALNPAFEELFGYDANEIVGKPIDEIVSSKAFINEARGITNRVSSGKVVRKVSQRCKKDGTVFDVEIIGIPVFSGSVEIGVLGIYHDISAQIEAENALKLSELRFRSLFNDSPISLWEEDFSEVRKLLFSLGKPKEIIERLENDDHLVQQCISLVKILNVNQATLDLYKAKSKAELFEGLASILTEESFECLRDELIAMVSNESCFECEIAQKRCDGEVIFGLLRLSVAPGYEATWEKVIISIVDITERQRAEKKLRFMSYHDNLTGLYNRAYFDEGLLELENSEQYPISIISFDLDKLKQINDSKGHEAGDRAIKGAARILSNVFRKEDLVARIGGDEFVAILPNVDVRQVTSLSQRLDGELSKYNQQENGDDLYRPISLSYGFTTIENGDSLIEGYKLADERMYHAKTRKKQDSNPGGQ